MQGALTGKWVGAVAKIRGNPSPLHRPSRGLHLGLEPAVHEGAFHGLKLVAAVPELLGQAFQLGHRIRHRVAAAFRRVARSAHGRRLAEVEFFSVQFRHIHQALAQGVQAYQLGLELTQSHSESIKILFGALDSGLHLSTLLGQHFLPVGVSGLDALIFRWSRR